MLEPSSRLKSLGVALAVAVPTLLAFNLPPSPTLLNQLMAMALWGGSLAAAHPRTTMELHPGEPLFVALVVVICTALATTLIAALPAGLALGPAAVLSCALVTAWSASTLRSSRALFCALLWGLLIAGVINACIGLLQVIQGTSLEIPGIAQSTLSGRAVGNLRQPNHLSSLLLWSLIALFTLTDLRRINRLPIALGLCLLLTTCLVLTGSRTGMLGALLLALWALFDRRLSRRVRVGLAGVPLVYGFLWVGVAVMTAWNGNRFGAEEYLASRGSGDISSSRFAIWSNTLSLICLQPWTGVGFGEFNLAWTLTEFPDRPSAFFDHSHNLLLQLLVELGVPLGALIIVLLSIALVQAARRSWRSDGDHGVARRSALMIVLMAGLHSLLEYPLWYAYFLLPTAFAWGFALTKPITNATEPAFVSTTSGSTREARTLGIIGLLAVVGAGFAAFDYRRVVVIYDPPNDASPLEERIVQGQRSLLFGHHADYAAATAFGIPQAPLTSSQELAFRRAPHQLLDIRLMIAWSQALASKGDLDKARWLAARIREFRNPGSDEYFAPCANPTQARSVFQCQAPARTVHWREFAER